jgi:hypothetical protein
VAPEPRIFRSERKLRWLGLLLAVALSLLVVSPAAGLAATDVTAFTIDSSIADPIGRGRTFVLTPDDGVIFARSVFAGVEVTVSTPDHEFTARVTPPTGQTLTPGTYPTTRFGSDTTAGLDVSGDGVGCNSSTGSVTVHEISVQTEPEPLVERFAATYRHSCEGTSPPLFGELRYRSTVDFRAATSDPLSVLFGTQLVGRTTAPASVTVANAGTLDLSLGSVSFSGPAAGDFAVSDDACSNATLTPGASCGLGVAFTPVQVGARSAVMHLADDTSRGGRDFDLVAVGFVNETAIGLRVAPAQVRYGEGVIVTAHLNGFEESTSKDLSIYAKPYGGVRRLIASGAVDGNGDLSASFTPKRKTTFVAKFHGDDVFSPSTSTTKKVRVSVIIDGALRNYDGTSGNYRLYRYTSRCPNAGKGCPTYITDVVPNHSGDPVCFQLQVFASGAWRNVFSCFKLKLGGTSKATAFFVYGSREIIGVRTRVRAEFRGDEDHLGDSSDWAYFKVTS